MRINVNLYCCYTLKQEEFIYRRRVLDMTILKSAILYADVSGSTRLYEQHGDKIARQEVRTCLDILTEVTNQHDGKVEKTIGDEVMCVFSNPLKAALAAAEMHEALRDASEEGRFTTGSLHVKIGWHYGTIRHEQGEIKGEAPITAQQIIRLAKADEILTSEQSIKTLPDEVRERARCIDQVEAEALEGDFNIYVMPWEEQEDVTTLSDGPLLQEVAVIKSLDLDNGDTKYHMDDQYRHCSIGRADDNDFCIHGRFVSRMHAKITFKHNRFHLQDESINGTAVINGDGRKLWLHREECVLVGSGMISFGSYPDEDADAVINFHCE